MSDVVAGLKALLDRGIKDGVAPGMACAVGDAEQTWFAEAGRFTYNAKSPPVDEKTLWDVASLTKIVATTSVAMALYQEHVLDLDAHVQSVVAEFVGDDKDDVTVRNLLLHDSGLPAYLEMKKHTNALAAKDEILRSALRAAPCTRTDYSCLGFITLMELMQRLTGLGMDELVRKYVTAPLGMSDTFYKPELEYRSRCAPTEKYEPWRKELEDLRGFKRVHETYVQGVVHDPIAFVLGGISGNAGLFSTSRDLARIARAWMGGAALRGTSSSRGTAPKSPRSRQRSSRCSLTSRKRSPPAASDSTPAPRRTRPQAPSSRCARSATPATRARRSGWTLKARSLPYCSPTGSTRQRRT